jgi:hypothetical protein
MVKGISRQVIVVQASDTQLFEQAIFILKQSTQPVTDEMLMKEAKRIMYTPDKKKLRGPVWACCGAGLTGIIWLFSIIL